MKENIVISDKISRRILMEEDIPHKIKKISFSQYSIFKQCPYRWYLTYAKKLHPFSGSIDTTFGTGFHETLQEYLRLLFNDSIKASEEFKMFSFLQEAMKKAYKEDKVKNENKHFTTPELLAEYYDDGCAILDYIKKKRRVLFDTKNYELIGIEVPCLSKIIDGSEVFYFNGFIDIVLYDKINDEYIIIDLKTSRQGWHKDRQMKDELKLNQILLYKRFFGKQFNVSEDKINVKFIIVKRKVWEQADYPQSRVQTFEPANGKLKVQSAYNDFNKFVQDCFDEEGNPNDYDYDKTPGFKMKNCTYCPFKDSPELCNKKND